MDTIGTKAKKSLMRPVEKNNIELGSGMVKKKTMIMSFMCRSPIIIGRLDDFEDWFVRKWTIGDQALEEDVFDSLNGDLKNERNGCFARCMWVYRD